MTGLTSQASRNMADPLSRKPFNLMVMTCASHARHKVQDTEAEGAAAGGRREGLEVAETAQPLETPKEAPSPTDVDEQPSQDGVQEEFLQQVRQASEADPWLKRDGATQRLLDHRDGCYWYADGELLYIPEAGDFADACSWYMTIRSLVIWVRNAPKSS